MLHRTSAWLCKSFSAPEEDLPNCVSQEAESPNQEQIQPLSVQGQVGLNAAGGIGALELHYAQ
jgi:hypothetical protein